MLVDDGRGLRFAIIGAGMAGILSAIKLTRGRAHRLHGLREGATGSAAPGARTPIRASRATCRRTSTRYSFAPNPDWSHRFSPGAEIQAYFERVAREHGVERHIRFGDEVTRCEFADGRWQLETAGGHRDDVDVVIAATGVLHHPEVSRHRRSRRRSPGAMFHSARWDHDVPLDGARVGIIGTGSTAVQIVVGDRRPGREALALPAHRAVDHAAGEPGRTPTRRRRRSAANPEQLAELHDEPRAGVRHLRQRGRRRRLAGDADDRGSVPREPREQRRATPSCASGCVPTTAPRASG